MESSEHRYPRRRLPAAVFFSALFLGGAVLILVLLYRGGPGGGGGDVPAPGGLEGGAAPAAAARPGGEAGAAEDPAKAEDPAAKDDTEPLPPPLLAGRVLGEGAGIAGATVQIYSTRLVEELLDRLQGLVPDGGQIPDLQAILAIVQRELEGVRAGARSARTDTRGVYEFRAIPTGSYLVLATADGWLFRFGDVTTVEEETTRTLDLELQRGFTIAGRVVDPQGSGLAGVRVLAEYRPQGAPGVGLLVRRLLRYVNGEFLRGAFEVTTGADGSFELGSLPAGLYDLAALERRGLEARLQGVDAGSQEAVIVLGAGAAVRALFTDGAGSPVGGTVFRLERQDDLLQLPLPMAGMADAANTVHRLLGQAPRSARTSPEGRLSFTLLGAGRYRLSLEERGFLPFTRALEVDWGETVDLGALRVDRGEVLSGVVQSEGGHPVAGARVSAVPARMNLFNMANVMGDFMTGRHAVESDAGGAFRIAGLVPGSYRLSALCGGYAPAVLKEALAGGEAVVLVLKPGVRIAGRVVERGSGRPIAGASVRAESSRARAGEDGRFVLQGVVPESANTRMIFDPDSIAGVPMPAGREHEADVRASAQGYLTGKVEVDLQAIPAELEIELAPVPAVAGVVLDPEGNPLPGSLARLVPVRGRMEFLPEGMDFLDRGVFFLAAAVTGPEGRFRFAGFRWAEASGTYQVIADHPLHARGGSEPFKLGPSTSGERDPDAEVTVRLLAAAVVRGTVTDGRGPVAGATVRAVKAPPAGKEQNPGQQMLLSMLGLPRGGQTVQTSASGEFRLGGLAPGAYQINAEMSGYNDSPVQKVDLTAGGQVELSLVLDPGAEVAGEVEDRARRPLPGAKIRLLREEGEDKGYRDAQKFFGGAFRTARADPEGRFRITGLPGGTFTVIAEHPGFTDSELKGVKPGKDPLRIVLVEAAALRGRVVDSGSGQAIRDFRVRMRRDEESGEQAEMLWNIGQEHQDAEGRFLSDDLAAGTYRIKVAARGYVPAERRVVLSSGQAAEVVFDLPQGGRIRGRVVDLQTRSPVQGAHIALGKARPPPGLDGETPAKQREGKEEDQQAMGEHFSRQFLSDDSVRSGEDGSFLLEGVPEGPQALLVRHDEFVDERKEGLEVGFGEELEAEVHLRKGLSVSGRVLDAAGALAPAKMVFLRGASESTAGIRKSALTSTEGEFRISGLQPGSYRLLLPESLRVEPGRAEASAYPGDPVTVQIDQDQSGIELRLPAGGE